jgi:hypothetical protein
MLCIQPLLTREGLKRILPEWDHSFLGDEVDAPIRFIRQEETRYASTSVSRLHRNLVDVLPYLEARHRRLCCW